MGAAAAGAYCGSTGNCVPTFGQPGAMQSPMSAVAPIRTKPANRLVCALSPPKESDYCNAMEQMCNELCILNGGLAFMCEETCQVCFDACEEVNPLASQVCGRAMAGHP
jgi:hypothetical protein